jgi:hypothetical protein
VTGERTVKSAFASAVLLSIWLGASLIVGAVVAPAAFAVLPTRTLGGALVGRVLPVLFWSGALAGALAAWLARGEHGRRSRVISSLVVVAGCLLAQLAVAPRIARTREAAGAPLDQLARDDSRRIAFGRLHAASVGLLAVSSIAAVSALLFTWRGVRLANRAERSTYPSHEL